MVKIKIAIVVQRFGKEVIGGAESLAYLLACLLNKQYDATVLTTRAISHNSWKNEYQEGADIVDGIKVMRFSVSKERDMQRFNQFAYIYNTKPKKSIDDDYQYLVEQGPHSPDLYDYLRKNKGNYDMFFIITYDFIHSYEAARILKEKAVFIPTAHNEPGLFRGTVKQIFKNVGGFIFLTEEEKQLVSQSYSKYLIGKPSLISGMYIDFVHQKDDCISNELSGIIKRKKRYVTYIGRIEISKGCNKLFEYFQRYLVNKNVDIDLVIAGKQILPIPECENVKYLGFINTQDKYRLLSNSLFLINPSYYESFSFIILEAWRTCTPVLVNGKCEVLKGQCIRSNGGLWYENYIEFEAMFDWMLENENKRKVMGANGCKYVLKNYSKTIIRNKLTSFIENYINKLSSSQKR